MLALRCCPWGKGGRALQAEETACTKIVAGNLFFQRSYSKSFRLSGHRINVPSTQLLSLKGGGSHR